MQKIYKVQSVSFPDERLLYAAAAEAKAQRRSLSNYICGLIEVDLGWDPTAPDPANPGRAVKPKAAAPRTPAKAATPSSAGASEAAGVLGAAAKAAPSRPAKSPRK